MGKIFNVYKWNCETCKYEFTNERISIDRIMFDKENIYLDSD